MLPKLPPKENKIEQHNFAEKEKAYEWLRRNGFRSSGYLTEEPYISFFVERFDKPGRVALLMNATYVRQDSLALWDQPYQIDIATLKEEYITHEEDQNL